MIYLAARIVRNTAGLVTLNDVAIRSHDRVAFEHTHWEIRNDQHWAVVGPNGSGKSTLMKAVCGQLPVVKGRIVYHFLGNGTGSYGPTKRRMPKDHIAYVSFDDQRAALGGGRLFYQARWNSGSGDHVPLVSEYLSSERVWRTNPYEVVEERLDPVEFEARRRRVIDLMGIEPLLGRSIVQLSNGERRKVFITQALLRTPQLLVLDNPFTGLDTRFRDRLKGVIVKLMQDQMRVILVTAEFDEIPKPITHILLVRDHQVVGLGPTEAILGSGVAETVARSGRPAAIKTDRSGEILPQREGGEDQSLIRMNRVNVSYNGVQVLSQINWTVRKGEHWTVLGPNGAGKTTLLSLLSGDNPQAYANDITLFGRRRGSGESIWEVKSRIGWVASELHLYYPGTVSCFDVVCSGFFDSIGLYRQCSPQQCQIARTWVEWLGLAHTVDAPFGKLSEGEQRMVLMARGLVKQPPLLILDEPCQGLDRDNRDRLLQTIDSVGSFLDTSVIYVTHRQALVLGLVVLEQS